MSFFGIRGKNGKRCREGAATRTNGFSSSYSSGESSYFLLRLVVLHWEKFEERSFDQKDEEDGVIAVVEGVKDPEFN